MQSKDGVEAVPKQEVKNKFRSNKTIFVETANSLRKSNFDAFLSFFLVNQYKKLEIARA